jgi:dihydroflavonol-4-reductase
VFSWTGHKVAVTGATGFVGSHAALELRRHGANVVALVRATSDVKRLLAAGVVCKIASLDDARSLASSLKGCDVVVHAAGAVGFDDTWDPFYRVNVQGTRTLLDAARQAKVRRFVHVSSIVAVGASETPASLDENAGWNLRSHHVPYVTTKRWAEEAALAANGDGLDVVVVNPASVVGPDDFTGSEFGTLCRRFWRGRIPFHFGGGNNYVDVRDVAQGIRLAAEQGRAGERYLLSGENRTYAAFFNDLCRAGRRTIPRLRLPNALAPVLGFVNDRMQRRSTKRPYLSVSQAALIGLYFYFDAAKARRELGFRARPLAQALADAHAFWMGAPTQRAIGA